MFNGSVTAVHGQEEIELVSLHKSLRLTDLQETLSKFKPAHIICLFSLAQCSIN